MATDVYAISNNRGHVVLLRTWLGTYRVQFHHRKGRYGISSYPTLKRSFLRRKTAEACYRSMVYKHLHMKPIMGNKPEVSDHATQPADSYTDTIR